MQTAELKQRMNAVFLAGKAHLRIEKGRALFIELLKGGSIEDSLLVLKNAPDKVEQSMLAVELAIVLLENGRSYDIPRVLRFVTHENQRFQIALLAAKTTGHAADITSADVEAGNIPYENYGARSLALLELFRLTRNSRYLYLIHRVCDGNLTAENASGVASVFIAVALETLAEKDVQEACDFTNKHLKEYEATILIHQMIRRFKELERRDLLEEVLKHCCTNGQRTAAQAALLHLRSK